MQVGPDYPQSPDDADVWLRLERSADEVIASTSSDGVSFSEIGRASPQLGASFQVGIAATDVAGPSEREFARGRVCALDLVVVDPRVKFHRGDPNSSGTIDISDGVNIFGFLFLGKPATLPCKESADSNNDGKIDISDGVYILNWLFAGGPPPVPPGPTSLPCGFDTDPPGSPGDIGCESYTECQ